MAQTLHQCDLVLLLPSCQDTASKSALLSAAAVLEEIAQGSPAAMGEGLFTEKG